MSRPVEADVVVVGGGVAGATIARQLAEAQHDVIVLDKATFPRDKPCGEGVMPTGVRLLDRLGILPRLDPDRHHRINGVRFITLDDSCVQGDFPDIGDGYHLGMGIKRLVLDAAVLEHARAHPKVSIHEDEAVTDVACSPDGVEVTTASSRYRARMLVGADGVRSLVRHKLGLELPRGPRQRYGMRAHFTFADGRALEDYVTVRMTERGECYTTPVSNTELEVALLIEKPHMKAFGGRLEDEFHRFLQSQPRLRGSIEGGQRTSPVIACGPFDVWARCRVADRALLVGDAGGYLDPITGEGISLALEGAVWGAEVIDAALRRDDLSARRLMSYHRRMSQAIRHYKLLTRGLLTLTRHPRLASLFARRMSRCPELYSKLLAINCGVRTFWDLRPRDLYRLLSA